MTKSKIFAVAFGLAASAAVGARAAQPAFNVRPGLWEVRQTTRVTGAPPIPAGALARMTPEQRARLQAAIQAEAGRGVARIVKRCVTLEQLRHIPDFGQGKNCKRTVLERSASEVALRIACKPNARETSSGAIHYQALNPETLSGTGDVTFSNGIHATTIHIRLSARWLGPDCGTAKP